MLRDSLRCHTANLLRTKDKSYSLYSTSLQAKMARYRDNIVCSLLFVDPKLHIKIQLQAIKHHMQFYFTGSMSLEIGFCFR